jgi:prepilin-type N-terminal cleavage/methylation domain-containing protein
MYRNCNEKLGFTLVELMVVIVLIGVLSAIGLPYYQGYSIKAKEDQAVNNIQSIMLAQTEYFRDRDSYFPCPPVVTRTAEIDIEFFGGEGELGRGAYAYEITGGCGSYSLKATPR